MPKYIIVINNTGTEAHPYCGYVTLWQPNKPVEIVKPIVAFGDYLYGNTWNEVHLNLTFDVIRPHAAANGFRDYTTEA